MALFRTFLVAFMVTLIAYTSVTISQHGWNLMPIFFGDMASFSWPGQFNLDFFGFLLMSGLWVAWRHQFSALGLLLVPVAVNGGMLFLTIYLLFLTVQAKGDMRVVLLGPGRTGGR
ncbi:MAG: hypothetical protein WCO82_07835 [Sphingomonadales bacterium]|jgi:hypothetical protein